MLPAISPQEAFERFSKGEARLVDIRETDEYTQEFVPGSRLIPLSIIAKHPLKDADAPDKPIVFFCHSGNRTANASDLLERLAGDVQAYRLDGGISGWEKAGLPVEHISSTIPLFRSDSDRGRFPGAHRRHRQCLLASVLLAVRLCRRGAGLRRDFRVLRPRRAAFAHAVEPALNRLSGK